MVARSTPNGGKKRNISCFIVQFVGGLSNVRFPSTTFEGQKLVFLVPDSIEFVEVFNK